MSKGKKRNRAFAIAFACLCIALYATWLKNLSPAETQSARSPAGLEANSSKESCSETLSSLIQFAKPKRTETFSANRVLERLESNLPPSPQAGEMESHIHLMASYSDEIRDSLIWLLRRATKDDESIENLTVYTAPKLDVLDEAARNKSTLDALSTAAFNKMHIWSIYKNKPGVFTQDNVVLITELYRLTFLLEETPVGYPRTNGFWRIMKKLQRYIYFQSPIQWKQDWIEPTQKMKEVYEAEGPRGLYRHIARRHGRIQALRYWTMHLKNAQTFILLGVVAAMSPKIFESLELWHSSVEFELPEGFDERDSQTLELVHADTLDVISKVESRISEEENSPELESLSELLQEVRKEILHPKQAAEKSQ